MRFRRYRPVILGAAAPGGKRVLGSVEQALSFVETDLDNQIRSQFEWQIIAAELKNAKLGASSEGVHKRLQIALRNAGWLFEDLPVLKRKLARTRRAMTKAYPQKKLATSKDSRRLEQILLAHK